jgi:hypothetical protein
MISSYFIRSPVREIKKALPVQDSAFVALNQALNHSVLHTNLSKELIEKLNRKEA